jgi:hypothetical protein
LRLDLDLHSPDCGYRFRSASVQPNLTAQDTAFCAMKAQPSNVFGQRMVRRKTAPCSPAQTSTRMARVSKCRALYCGSTLPRVSRPAPVVSDLCFCRSTSSCWQRTAYSNSRRYVRETVRRSVRLTHSPISLRCRLRRCEPVVQHER